MDRADGGAGDPFAHDADGAARDVPADACPTEDELARLLEQGLANASDLHAHVARCAACRGVLAMAASRTGAAPASPPSTLAPSALSPAPRAPAPGERVGRYVILECIGAGAMGDVYVAHDPDLDRRVAVKILRDATEDGETRAERDARLRREAKAMARLSHPNVVAVHDVGTWDDRIFIAMALVEGGTLRAWCDAAPRSWTEVLRVYALAGRGLAAAHAAGLIHRDFKPDNVLVTASREAYVTDFGLARIARDDGARRRPTDVAPHAATIDAPVTRTGALVGTPAYMSPEQIDAGAIDARSDVFSFSIALWEALYGARPFHAATIDELRRSMAHEPEEPGKSAVPRAILDVLRAGLREDPRDRPPSMDALLDALESASGAEGSSREASPRRGAEQRSATTPVGAAPKEASRTRWTAIASLAVAALVTAALRLVPILRHSPNTETMTAVPAPRLERLTSNSSEAPVYTAALAPNGAEIAYVDSRGVFVEEIASRQARRLELTPKLKDARGSIAWYPDGARLLVGGHGEDGVGDLWTVDIGSGSATPMHIGDWLSSGVVSPDGRHVAVVEYKAKWEGAVEIVDIPGGARRTIFDTNHEELIFSPRWSPDGRRVAIALGTMAGDALTYRIDIVDVASKAQRTVVSHADITQETGDVAFTWSGDGRLYVALAPSTFFPERTALFAIDAADLDVDDPSKELPPLHPIHGLAGVKIYDMSSNASGRDIAITRTESQADVIAGSLSADGAKLDDVERLTLSDGNEWASDWSADSKDILVVSDTHGGHGTFALSLITRDMMPIAGGTSSTTWPVLGPAGNGILYWRLPPDVTRGRLDLVLTQPDRTSTRVFETPREIEIHGRGRPAPRRWTVRCARASVACFVAWPSGQETSLLRLDVASGKTTALAQFPWIWNFGFALSPEGERIAVPATNQESIDVFHVDGSLIRRLSADRARFTSATWLNDGAALIATGADADAPIGALFRLGLDGTLKRLWSTKEGIITNPVLSPDGRHLAFTVLPFHTNVWLLKR